MLKTRPGWESLKTYTIDCTEWAVKLDANEKADNLPPVVQQAVSERLAAIQFNRYPDMGAGRLRAGIAANNRLAATNVLIGNGSSELLAAACYTFGGSGRSIVFPSPSFSMYPVYVKLADSIAKPVGLEADYSLDYRKVVETARLDNPSLIILCNPNNPTGSVMPLNEIETIIKSVACPVIVDEAYYEFYGHSALDLLSKYPNLIIIRTFSKAYGLAAARVGYLLAAENVVAEVSKALLPYHMNSLSLAAAETVYEYKEHFASAISNIIAERERVFHSLSEIPGLQVLPSQTNFLLIRSPEAKKLSAYLAAKSIGIRDFSNTPGLEGCVRVSIGTETENNLFLQAVKECLNSDSNS